MDKNQVTFKELEATLAKTMQTRFYSSLSIIIQFLKKLLTCFTPKKFFLPTKQLLEKLLEVLY